MATKKKPEGKPPVPRATTPARPIKLSEAVTGADVAALAPHDRRRMSAQVLADGTVLGSGGVPRDKPFPSPVDISKSPRLLD